MEFLHNSARSASSDALVLGERVLSPQARRKLGGAGDHGKLVDEVERLGSKRDGLRAKQVRAPTSTPNVLLENESNSERKPLENACICISLHWTAVCLAFHEEGCADSQ